MDATRHEMLYKLSSGVVYFLLKRDQVGEGDMRFKRDGPNVSVRQIPVNITYQVCSHSPDPAYKVGTIFHNITAGNLHDVFIVPEFGEGLEGVPQHLYFPVTFSVVLRSVIPREGHQSDQAFRRRSGRCRSMKCGQVSAGVLAKENVGVALEGEPMSKSSQVVLLPLIGIKSFD
jgi:hypothetical protein